MSAGDRRAAGHQAVPAGAEPAQPRPLGAGDTHHEEVRRAGPAAAAGRGCVSAARSRGRERLEPGVTAALRALPVRSGGARPAAGRGRGSARWRNPASRSVVAGAGLLRGRCCRRPWLWQFCPVRVDLGALRSFWSAGSCEEAGSLRDG